MILKNIRVRIGYCQKLSGRVSVTRQALLVSVFVLYCICILLHLYPVSGGGRYLGGRKSSAEAATETDWLMEKEGQSCVCAYIFVIIAIVVIVIAQQTTIIDRLADGALQCTYIIIIVIVIIVVVDIVKVVIIVQQTIITD